MLTIKDVRPNIFKERAERQKKLKLETAKFVQQQKRRTAELSKCVDECLRLWKDGHLFDVKLPGLQYIEAYNLRRAYVGIGWKVIMFSEEQKKLTGYHSRWYTLGIKCFKTYELYYTWVLRFSL
jgi:hypothetical protein